MEDAATLSVSGEQRAVDRIGTLLACWVLQRRSGTVTGSCALDVSAAAASGNRPFLSSYFVRTCHSWLRLGVN